MLGANHQYQQPMTPQMQSTQQESQNAVKVKRNLRTSHQTHRSGADHFSLQNLPIVSPQTLSRPQPLQTTLSSCADQQFGPQTSNFQQMMPLTSQTTSYENVAPKTSEQSSSDILFLKRLLFMKALIDNKD
jgi:hypothetical protein